nr:nonstructural protein NS4A [Hepacivirus otomopis]YP_009664189.1 nonstructural protein NS4A [Bat hepacivirus]
SAWILTGAAIAAVCVLTETTASIAIVGEICLNDGKIFLSPDKDHLYGWFEEMEEC